MKIRTVFLSAVLAVLAAPQLPAQEFALTPDKNYAKLSYRGRPFIDYVLTRVQKSANFAADAQSKLENLPDGGKVFNIWSQIPDTRFRQEVALHGQAQDKLEISYLTERPAYRGYPGRRLEIVMPYSFFEGATYQAYIINSRQVKKIQGKFTADLPDGALGKAPIRFMAIEKGDCKLIFDFNPLGPGDYMNNYRQSSIRGIWDVVRQGGKMILRQNTSLPEDGGLTGSKVIIQPGTFSDYDKLHALREFHYTGKFTPRKLYSFGAAAVGKDYTRWDLKKFDPLQQTGWGSSSDSYQSKAHSAQGAYYGTVSGKDGKFKLSGLANGLYIVSAGAGNFGQQDNCFEILCNQQSMSNGSITIEPMTANIFSLPVYVENNTVELEFKGNFIVSTIGLQFLLSEHEDFSCKRPFWVTDGFEPAILFRNEYWSKAVNFKPVLEKFALPVPGKETAAPLKKPARPVSLPPDAEAMKWRCNARTFTLRGYTLNEWAEDRAAFEKHLDKHQALNYNVLMAGGLHARHTYKGHEKRALDELQKIFEAAHKRNMKVIDHHDATLLWNTDSGFRVMAERLSETERDIDNNLANHRFCIMNEKFTETYLEYCRELVRRGADGLQLDELNFFNRGCVCSHCRKKFHEATNWYLPVNELDPGLHKHTSKLHQVWSDWKLAEETNFMVRLRNEINKINPNVTILQYTTHYGFTSSRLRLNFIARDMEEYARAVDFFGTEVMTRNPFLSIRAVVPLRKAFNLLKFAYNTPIWGLFYNNNWHCRYLAYAISNMNAQQPMLFYMQCPPGMTDYQTFPAHKDNMDSAVARPQARIALFFSRASRDFNRRVGFTPELFGLAQTLEEMHVPYQIIGEVSLKPEILKEFDIVSLGSSGCMSDEQIAAVKKYVENGGTVLLANITGLFDQFGNDRKSWAFADIFGGNQHATPLKNIKTIVSADGSTFDKMEPSPYFTFKPVARSRGNEHAVETPIGKLPLWVEKSYGKGKFIYQPIQLAGSLYAMETSINAVWKFKRDDKLAAFLHKALREKLGAAAYWQTDAPEKVYTTIYREPHRYLIHFLNATGSNPEFGKVITADVPKDAYPALSKSINFTIPVKDMTIKQVYAVSPDFAGRKALNFQISDGQLSAELPPELLKVYSIVILDSRD